MAILGVSYTRVEAEKNLRRTRMSVRTTPKINDVKVSKLAETKSDVLSVKFSFETQYGEGAGKIHIEGILIYKGDEPAKKIAEKWEKEKKLPIDTDIEIKNYLLRKVVIQALNLADMLQLPPVVELPRVVKGTKSSDKKETKKKTKTK